MDGVYHLIASRFKAEHSKRQEVSGSPLDSTLENTTADERVPAPLPSNCVLAVDSHPHLLTTPWCGEQLNLWPLPADETP